jgi:hypothetical protein
MNSRSFSLANIIKIVLTPVICKFKYTYGESGIFALSEQG